MKINANMKPQLAIKYISKTVTAVFLSYFVEKKKVAVAV